ncbi:caspase family protein, partial [Pantanalinema rosaneae CENA516]|uniref:caspase family protein n=1 Tax=Pantanalinema rosaneae TaxID=1620701 RepID=UPI003D6DD258
MSKVALLIGVSEYLPDLKPLPAAVQDVEAIQAILQNPEIGHFDEVKTLINPVPMEMQEAIEALFTGRAKDDLVLLFFSGHGIKDDNGRLFFATRSTRKHPNGELVKATTVPASFVHDVMNYSRSKRQVVVLDCCFGGAFAEGLAAKDDGSIDVRSQLGGEGRAILTSSASTQYSFEQASDRLSIYTRYLVEGIETGLADLDNDGMISVDELHEYASGKVREVTTSMKPEIYAVKEGFKIHLVHAPVSDPQSRYRKEVERFAQQGEISEIARTALEVQREKLGLSYREATLIEAEVIEPYREHRHKLQRYRQVFDEAIRREFPLSDRTRNELKLLQQTLNLIEEDIALIESQGLLSQAQTITPAQSQQINKEEGQKLAKHFKYKFHFLLIIGTIAILIFGLTTYSKTTVFSSLLGWINSCLLYTS